jgi:hypothetical protein
MGLALVKKMDTNGDGKIPEIEFDTYRAMNNGDSAPGNN